MSTASVVLQILIPLGIANVWFLRAGRPTAYRGGSAKNLRDEFTAYGLSGWIFCVVGALKVTAAALIFAGLFVPLLVQAGALLMTALMLGAVFMHARVKDPAIRFLPATLMLLMSVVLLVV